LCRSAVSTSVRGTDDDPQNKYDWAGKLKGESLLRNAPAAKAEEE
jgi:hypothetical protein